MIVERVEHPDWLSNAYLVADGRQGVFIDSNGVTAPLVERVESDGIRVSHVLCTHEHADHIEGMRELAERLAAEVVLPGELSDGWILRVGELEIRALATPGHAREHFAFVVNETECFTGDVLFRRTVGGTRGGGATGFDDLKRSIMDELLSADPETRIWPGHKEPTTVVEEWEENPFVRVWRGAEPERAEPCRVRGEEATLVLWADDYDGGHKAWVRFPSGEDAVVGGSQVERL